MNLRVQFVRTVVNVGVASAIRELPLEQAKPLIDAGLAVLYGDWRPVVEPSAETPAPEGDGDEFYDPELDLPPTVAALRTATR